VQNKAGQQECNVSIKRGTDTGQRGKEVKKEEAEGKQAQEKKIPRQGDRARQREAKGLSHGSSAYG
jgi:hypothetical protein